MRAKKKKALEAAAWKFGDAAEFLEMSDEERQLLDARAELALAVRRRRESRDLSQKQLGALLKTSQPRIAKIERAAPDVSLDQLVRAFNRRRRQVCGDAGEGEVDQGKNRAASRVEYQDGERGVGEPLDA